jgi:hypothetical protein
MALGTRRADLGIFRLRTKRHGVLFIFYLKHNVSETEFCFRLQVELAQFRTIDKATLYLRRHSLRNVLF